MKVWKNHLAVCVLIIAVLLQNTAAVMAAENSGTDRPKKIPRSLPLRKRQTAVIQLRKQRQTNPPWKRKRPMKRSLSKLRRKLLPQI